MTNDPLQLPIEVNLLETLQRAQYTALPVEMHVAVISIPLQARTWWIIRIKLQWISYRKDSRERKVHYSSTFSFCSKFGHAGCSWFWFSPPPQKNKNNKKSYFQLIEKHIKVTAGCAG